MAKVYVILEGAGYYGGDYDEMNSDVEWFICVYENKELAKAHLKKWEEDIRKHQSYLNSTEYKWTYEEYEVRVDNVDEKYHGSWNYCKYEEHEMLQEVRLE